MKKVIYSVATRLGGSGIGTTAHQAVGGIFAAGLLKRVYCSSKAETEIPNHLVFSTNSSFFEGLRFLPSSYRWLFKDITHDLITSVNLPRVVRESTSTSSLCSDEVDGAPNLLDIFHVWNGHGLFSLRQAKKLGARIVVERASSHPQTYERIMNQEYRIRGLRFNQMIGFNKKRLLQEFVEADFITVSSDFSYDSMVENGIPKKNLIKIPFGVDLTKFQPRTKNTGHRTFNVLFVGQVGFRKGVLYLLEAWKKLGLKDAKLRILGQEDPEIKSFLAIYRNDPSVEFLGYGNSLELYQQSDLFVFPSLEEGSALVVYEALACGLPVITTFESGSVVENEVEGYIAASAKVDELAERIQYLYDNSNLRARMAQKARQKAERYSWENYGKNLVGFYQQI